MSKNLNVTKKTIRVINNRQNYLQFLMLQKELVKPK